MGVFKWLRRERVTVSSEHITTISPGTPDMQAGTTIRTEEYERALAEFRARRSSLSEDRDTPEKKRNGRNSLPVSCTSCTGDPDKSFNYEKRSAAKYKTKTHRRARSAQPDHAVVGDVTPNIQFLFQNQVFMPGRMLPASYSEPARVRRQRPLSPHPTRIDFNDDRPTSPPFYYKNNSIPLHAKDMLEEKSYREEVDGVVDDSVRADGRRCDETLLEAINELKMLDRWADEQLVNKSTEGTTTDETKSTSVSSLGLTVASTYNLDVLDERDKVWSNGKWGVVPVMLKRMAGVRVEHVRKKLCPEINMLRKYRHPNIILLMGLYPDAAGDVHIVCERCVDSLHNLIHVEGVILSVQTSVQYASNVADALVFLRMQGFIHTELSSAVVMITAHRTAKLADLGACAAIVAQPMKTDTYSVYTPEPHYVNLPDSYKCNGVEECEPLLPTQPSEVELGAGEGTWLGAARRPYAAYARSQLYRWQAPELFAPDDDGHVRPCSRSDVYSLCMILWECCNALLPWKCLSYESLREQYTVSRRGVVLPQDGTYPGSVLALLHGGLQLERSRRPDLLAVQETLLTIKKNIDEMEYIVIPARRTVKANEDDEVDVSTRRPEDDNTSTGSRRETNTSPEYETIPRTKKQYNTNVDNKSPTSDDTDEGERKLAKYKYFDCKNYSSACSTPVHKIRERVGVIETPGAMHRSDSTEYCSILSPDTRFLNVDSVGENSAEHAAAKLCRSFTPQSYKPLHINVPEYNLDSVKSILKDQTNMERSSYKFDIKNCSLPSTPIARSNQLRKNAWLSGSGRRAAAPVDEGEKEKLESAAWGAAPVSAERARRARAASRSAESVGAARDSFTGLRRISHPPHDFSSPEVESAPLERTRSLNCVDMAPKYKIEEDILAAVNVKPLVAIHERWIHEANKKTGRSLSLPEPSTGTGTWTRPHVHAVKPASHCVDTLQRTQRQSHLQPPAAAHNDGNVWERYYQTREAISKSLILHPSDTIVLRKSEKSTITEVGADERQKVDRSTDTREIDEFIRDLIRKEILHLLDEMSENASENTSDIASDDMSDTPGGRRRGDDVISRGVTNVIESLKNTNESEPRRDAIRSYSRIKINGNNKPLVQITFSRSGDSRLEVLDERVDVTLADAPPGDVVPAEGAHHSALKRCQTFSAIQEARSTEDLYIDDDLSTQMQENFGGKVKLIPLHGSLHEILCEKEDDCCLIKVKQENGCDTIYFRCDNSDTESRDAIDGQQNKTKDTVVFKRSISLIEERVQRVFPKDKRLSAAALKKLNDRLRARPKSEVMFKKINKDSRALSSSTPSLSAKEDKSDEVELNIENEMCYQDSSSDECLRYADDDFEMLERAIEEDLANNSASLTCGCLEKISEENLSIMNEDY